MKKLGIASSSNQKELGDGEERNWLDLPSDIMLLIVTKLDVVQLLRYVQHEFGESLKTLRIACFDKINPGGLVWACGEVPLMEELELKDIHYPQCDINWKIRDVKLPSTNAAPVPPAIQAFVNAAPEHTT
ncbi:hypothetical protein IFM89_036497 [Coptis chinensis]|uniref:F-box domain-containing protein n=1 Tax=Coptis chinensis TaxID=261450 RepID=A0A835I8D1_9MAGN|nr:hypothetical protein IFM89_036497 [Coptis chinensis]